jgi:hypothetical protein
MYKNISKEKIYILQKIFPMYNPQRYKALSTFKKENKKWWNMPLALSQKYWS